MRAAHGILIVLLVVCFITAVIVVLILFVQPASEAPLATETVRLGLPLQSPAALFMFAIDEGFFAEHGQHIEVTKYPSGKRALKALTTGQVDIASGAGVPFVFASFHHSDIRIIASIGMLTQSIERIIARKDRSIHRPEDLRGKTIGTQKGSGVHFFLHVFLAKHGLSKEDVTIVFRKAEELAPALINGDLDAFSMREPYVGAAIKELGDNATVFEASDIYFRSELLITTEAFLKKRPQTAQRIINAFIAAEKAATEDQGRLARVVVRRLGASLADTERIQKEIQKLALKVSLSQYLLLSLENEAKWAVNSGLVAAKAIPNYLRFISPEALDAAAPHAITIIR